MKPKDIKMFWTLIADIDFFLDPMPERTPEDTKNDLKKMIQQADGVQKEIYRLSEVFNKLQMEISQLLNVLGVVKKDLEK